MKYRILENPYFDKWCIELEIQAYKNWCKKNNLKPCDANNLKSYCDSKVGA
jgi:hypothetical protein